MEIPRKKFQCCSIYSRIRNVCMFYFTLVCLIAHNCQFRLGTSYMDVPLRHLSPRNWWPGGQRHTESQIIPATPPHSASLVHAIPYTVNIAEFIEYKLKKIPLKEWFGIDPVICPRVRRWAYTTARPRITDKKSLIYWLFNKWLNEVTVVFVICMSVWKKNDKTTLESLNFQIKKQQLWLMFETSNKCQNKYLNLCVSPNYRSVRK